MELEPHQYAVLKTYQKWRRKPPTNGSLMRANFERLAVVAIYCALAGFGCLLLGLKAFILLFAGFWVGQVVAEFTRIRTVPVAWSVLEHVLDWTRVEKAIANRSFDDGA
jgi:hypothetical protein